MFFKAVAEDTVKPGRLISLVLSRLSSTSVAQLICPLASSPLCPSHRGRFVCPVPGQFRGHSDSQTWDNLDPRSPPHHRYRRNLGNTHTHTHIINQQYTTEKLSKKDSLHITPTATVHIEADWGSGQAVDKISPGTGLHIDTGVPLAAVVVEAGAGRQGDDAFVGLRVAAVEPDGSVRAAVVFGDAEGGHRIPGHAREAVPFSGHVAVTKGPGGGLFDVIVCVPPGFVQAGVRRARVQS